MQTLGKLVATVFDRLNQANVRYIVMRNYEKYPHVVGNDIDILLHCDDTDVALAETRAVYQEFGLVIKALPVQSNGFLLKAQGPDALSLAIHFQYWISFEFSWLHNAVKGFSYKLFFEALEVKKHINADCQFFIASDADRFIMLLKQWLFKKKPAYKSELIALFSKGEIKSLFHKAKLQTNMDSEALFKTDKITTSVMRRLIQIHWSKQSQLANYYKAFRMALNNKKKNLLAPVIYVTGPDGAGKTSVSAILSEALSDKGLSYKHVYSVKRNIIRHFIFAIRRKISGKKDNKFSDDPSGRKFRFIMTEDITDRDTGSTLWRLRKFTTLCISIFDVFINFVPVIYFRFKHDVVIVETSPYDIFIKYHMPEFDLLEKVFAPLFPKAAMGLLLKADSEKIAARKHELTPSEIDSYYERLNTLLVRAGCREDFHTVRTDIVFSDTRDTLIELLSSEKI